MRTLRSGARRAAVMMTINVRRAVTPLTLRSGLAGSVVTHGMTPVGVSVVVLQRNAVLLAAFVRAR